MLKRIRRIIFYLIVFVLTGFIFWVSHLLLGKRDAVILMYHSIGKPVHGNSSLDVSEEVFERQMRFLSRYHYRVIPLAELADLLKEKKRIPWRTVVLTFDDGFEDNYTKAYPILKKYHLPATIFIIVNRIGKKGFMVPAIIKEMSDSGLITIGAHTNNHFYLPFILDAKVLWDEIYGSKAALEKMVDKPVDAFCYPSGGYTPAIKKIVQKAGYKVAVTTFPYQGLAQEDLYAIKRIKVTENSGDLFVFFIQTSGYFIRMKELQGFKK
jgi:peptidoglycan/xylan/chitin deacetylase (PgdA/CDA1 family)